MLDRKRIDAIVGVIESIYFNALLASKPTDTLFDVPYVIQQTPITLACNRTIPTDMHNRLTKALETLKNSGEIDQIIQKFFSDTTMNTQKNIKPKSVHP